MRLIDADALLNNTDGLDHVKYSQEYGHVVPVCDIVYAPTVDAAEVVRCKDAIGKLPSAQPERKMGKWIKVKPISEYIEAYMCPFCKTGDWDISVDSYNYCPYCGKSVSGVADDPSHPFVDDVMMKGEEDGCAIIQGGGTDQ